MATTAVKITRKGQVTIPKEIRKKIKTDAVYFELAGDSVLMKPVPDAAGSLRKYARRTKIKGSLKQIKEAAWEDVIREKNDAKLSGH